MKFLEKEKNCHLCGVKSEKIGEIKSNRVCCSHKQYPSFTCKSEIEVSVCILCLARIPFWVSERFGRWSPEDLNILNSIVTCALLNVERIQLVAFDDCVVCQRDGSVQLNDLSNILRCKYVLHSHSLQSTRNFLIRWFVHPCSLFGLCRPVLCTTVYTAVVVLVRIKRRICYRLTLRSTATARTHTHTLNHQHQQTVRNMEIRFISRTRIPIKLLWMPMRIKMKRQQQPQWPTTTIIWARREWREQFTSQFRVECTRLWVCVCVRRASQLRIHTNFDCSERNRTNVRQVCECVWARPCVVV